MYLRKIIPNDLIDTKETMFAGIGQHVLMISNKGTKTLDSQTGLTSSTSVIIRSIIYGNILNQEHHHQQALIFSPS